MESKKYYIGLDIGTDSIGYAVTDEQYSPIKHKGEPMMGTHLLEPAETKEARRGFRAARRRLNRKQQRVELVRQLFAEEIAKVDEDFYKRLDASALCCSDKPVLTANSFFDDENYKDKDYHKQFPTIHHLIDKLMKSDESYDVRLVFLAVSWLVSHRGHFLNRMDKDDVEGVRQFDGVYAQLMSCFDTPPWTCDAERLTALKNVLKNPTGVKVKEQEITSILFGAKAPAMGEDDFCDMKSLVSLLAGGKVGMQKLFDNDEYKDISIALSCNDEEFDNIISNLGDNSALLIALRNVYNWGKLAYILPDGVTISEKKVADYEKHGKDLRFLKGFARKYLSEKKYIYDKSKRAVDGYTYIFRVTNQPNYAAYSYNANTKNAKEIKKKATKHEFCAFLLSLVKDIAVEECDREQYEDMLRRLDKNAASFMSKQLDADVNRLFPYQLYYYELKRVLDNAKRYLPFLNMMDSSGLSVEDKLLSVFTFRVPYYVGPLNAASEHAWLVRTAEKIYPWNFESVVDLDKSEEQFIKRMTNFCTYLPGEKVLPKNSLLYTKFALINILNNIKINNVKLDVDIKQRLLQQLLLNNRSGKVTTKAVKNALKSLGIEDDELKMLSGIDDEVSLSIKPYTFFSPYLSSGRLTDAEVESIIAHKAYCEDNFRFKKWLKREYEKLSDAEVNAIAAQNFKEFGTLSRALLSQLEGTCKLSGETMTVIDFLYETQYNFMQIISSDEFTFAELLAERVKEYYACDENRRSVSERLDEMYISNSVKRPIIRTLSMVKEIVKASGCAPAKIFVEMARGEGEKQRTKSRRDKIIEQYKQFKNSEETKALLKQLSDTDDGALRSDKIFLYFMQMGKCMYSGEAIDLDAISSKQYDIDHIYPQCFVKDNSLDNKALVLSQCNADKGDKIVPAKFRERMQPMWKSLLDKGNISLEKYQRLTRSHELTDDEKLGFINRQLVETRQSTKAVAMLLKELYPDTEIVYVKAGLVSEYRQYVELYNCRTVNDLHHAKDAYLNIVVGNVYSCMFAKNFHIETAKYSMKTETIFKYVRKCGDTIIWNGEADIAKTKMVLSKNNIHLTTQPITKKGLLFKQTLQKASDSDALISIKKGMDTKKYGGYTASTASFFILVKCNVKKKTEVVFLPIDLMFADRFDSNDIFAREYIIGELTKLFGCTPENISLPLKNRKIKINTILELDGFRVFISGKGDDRLLLSPLMSLKISGKWERYIKRLESFAEKKKNNSNLTISPGFDKITTEENIELYDIYSDKLLRSVFSKMPAVETLVEILSSGRNDFIAIPIEKQAEALMNIGEIFKSHRKGGCDLRFTNKGSAASGYARISSKLSNVVKDYSYLYIVDVSSTGLFETRSQNLFDFLK